ncbi:TetR/AcrR family transcriptional regulator [Actinoplanes derwentensis]|uniref:DNA-binding transcriptional regulator, AcrR family n=1 Tax=Actinoplanes derwentensis TaxID=113562 RepID=A0A1H1VIS0_9ACTN|nr:TetR/AcrR family transcriptional regulator [Actinoplanes derwentensis]GID83693.1 TetR family transcriptional regulator [Actinoplanes derwentensis]SDS84241.1 DNA-binding transcriptional regulator, AcrR family [Actinoplanes derwentensis]
MELAEGADTRSRIVSAAAEILREQGARAVTTRAVAQAARVQAPTIYRLFSDKDGLIDAVAEHVMATYVSAKSSAGPGSDPVADLRAGWQAQIDFGLANPWLYELMTSPARAERSPATAAGIDVLRAKVHRLATAGLLRVDEPRAVAMIHAAGSGTVRTLLGLPAEQRDLGLADQMFDAVAANILTGTPAAPASDVGAVVVTFATALPGLPGLTGAERALMAEWLTRSLTRLHEPTEPGTVEA